MFGRRYVIALLAVIALIAAACSSGAGATASPTASAAPPSVAATPEPSASAEESPTAEASEAAGEDYPLVIATVAAGKTLTGEDGKTLYIFKADTKDSGKSVCNTDCAVAWPPYVLESDEKIEAGDGVGGAITMITRDDGTSQVAYNGWPLYYFKGDAKAGDSKGQNIDAFGGVWVIAAP
jgi:predicted lipoprotein with Yx(FWY)xxD motif